MDKNEVPSLKEGNRASDRFHAQVEDRLWEIERRRKTSDLPLEDELTLQQTLAYGLANDVARIISVIRERHGNAVSTACSQMITKMCNETLDDMEWKASRFLACADHAPFQEALKDIRAKEQEE